jgi:hypothetical protein
MIASSLISRDRKNDSEISRKHGHTLLRTLHKSYGPASARDYSQMTS